MRTPDEGVDGVASVKGESSVRASEDQWRGNKNPLHGDGKPPAEKTLLPTITAAIIAVALTVLVAFFAPAVPVIFCLEASTGVSLCRDRTIRWCSLLQEAPLQW